MATIRRNPGLFALLGMFVVGLGLGLLLWPHTPATAGEPTYDPLSAVASAEIDRLLRDAGLDDDLLATLNVSDAQLDALLPAVRSWYEAHGPEWRSAVTALAEQQARIRYFEARLNTGHNEAAALAAARQQLTQLNSAYATLLAGLRTAALGSLSDSQRTLAEQMRVRPNSPMPFRILDLTAEQTRALNLAATRYQQRLALTRSQQTQTALTTQYAHDLELAIGTSNVQRLTALREYRGAAAARVVAARLRIFPTSAEG